MEKNKYHHILCFGEVLWDMLPTGPKPGGAPLNVAIHLIRQGHTPALISKIGNDSLGLDLVRFITEARLDRKLIQVDESLPTSQVIIHLDEKKNATYEICEPVAWDNIQLTPENQQAAKKADLVILVPWHRETIPPAKHFFSYSKIQKLHGCWMSICAHLTTNLAR